MSEGRDGREDQGITSPEVDENHGMGDISPVMSYERGNDYLERTTSEGEPKYKGKGKAISESFTHLPATVPSTPSTAPSTRPTSEIPDASTPSTGPSTRPNSDSPGAPGPSTAPPTGPVSQAQDDKVPSTVLANKAVNQAQADPEPSTADDKSSVTETKHHSVGIAAHGDAEPSTDEAEPASATGQGDSAGISAQDGTPHHTGQSGSGPIESQDEVPPGPIESQDKAATGPTSLDCPSNFEPAIEPSGPPNPLTNIPSAKDKPLEESGPATADPKATDPLTPQAPSDPPQVDKGAHGSQANEPQTTEPTRVELGGIDRVPDTRRSTEVGWELPTETPANPPPNSPHHRADIVPKPILKKTAGTAAEAQVAEEGGLRPLDAFGPNERGLRPLDAFGPDGASEAQDPRGGAKRFRGALANYKATRHSRKVEADVVGRLNTETESGVGTPRLANKGRNFCLSRCTLL